VALASRGLRNMDRGEEKIEDANELARVRAQARKVYVQSALFAVAVTLVVLLLPV
jgi:hypothetical protein